MIAAGAHRIGTATVSGFVGTMRYECDGTDSDAAGIDALMRLAPISGVGAYTQRGLGVVTL